MASISTRRPEQDWDAWRRAQNSFTTEQLQQFNAAGVDSYLIQIGELIGLHINIPPHGQRNLATAFSRLYQLEMAEGRMGIGFSDRHIARILALSDGGFTFLGILGCLSEYFVEDVVVAVIMKLLRSLTGDGLPDGCEPDDIQWKHLVHTCHGVLATSPFGVLITQNLQDPNATASHASISQIVSGLVDMSTFLHDSTGKVSIDYAGADACWFAAVAEYVFDLRAWIQVSDESVPSQSSALDSTNAQCIITSGNPSPHNEDSFGLQSLSIALPNDNESSIPSRAAPFQTRTKLGAVIEIPRVATPVTGGRVAWDNLFRSSFGRAFTEIEPSHIAEFTGGAASLLASTLQYDQTKSQEFFLPHASTVRGLSGYGLVETVTSWFPELRRMAPQMGKIARLPFQQARDKMDEISNILESRCPCSSCSNVSTSTEFCRHSVVEVIMELGMFIARTVVIPNLYPKRSGVLAFYQRLHAARLVYRTSPNIATEAFMQGFVAAFPTPRNMIETMCLLFSGSVSRHTTDHTIFISHDGLLISLYAWHPNAGARDPENENVLIRQRVGVSVQAGSWHLHGRIYNHGYWSPAFRGASEGSENQPLSFNEGFELLKTSPRAVQHAAKPRMGDLMLAHIRAGTAEEERVTRLGWVMV